MNAIKRITIALALIGAFGVAMPTGGAMAQEFDDEHLAAAKTAITASRVTRRLDNILLQAAISMKTQLIKSRPDKESEISDIVDTEAIKLAARRRTLEDEIGKIYARLFTAEELVQIAGFYGSEAGQKMLDSAPILGREIDQAAKIWSNGISRDMAQSVTQAIADANL